MQGTIVLLMAFSGLGCHHTPCNVVAPTSYDVGYVSDCGASYGSSCGVSTCDSCGTAPVAYSSGYSSYSSCGTSMSYSNCAPRRHGLFAGLFSCFKKKNACAPVGYDACGGSMAYGSYDYSMPVYGDYTGTVMSGSYGSTQISDGGYISSGQYTPTTQYAPAEVVAPTDAAAPAAVEPPPIPAVDPAIDAAIEEATPPIAPEPGA